MSYQDPDGEWADTDEIMVPVSEEEFEAAEIVIRDQALTIEGLGQANTELQREVADLTEYNRLGTQVITRLRAAVQQAVNDVRALRDVPIGQLDDCIADIVSNLIEAHD